jgi:hypothetical protein
LAEKVRVAFQARDDVKPGALRIAPPEAVLKHLGQDYEPGTSHMIFGDAPKFEDIMDGFARAGSGDQREVRERVDRPKLQSPPPKRSLVIRRAIHRPMMMLRLTSRVMIDNPVDRSVGWGAARCDERQFIPAKSLLKSWRRLVSRRPN